MNRHRTLGRGLGKMLPALLALTLLCSGTAQAGFLTAFSGNTQPQDSGGTSPPTLKVGGTINFTVLDRTGGSAGDTFGTGLAGFDTTFVAAAGSGAFDTTAKYLYLFQVVNNGLNKANFPVSTSSLGTNVSLTTSLGSFTGTSFTTTVLGAPAGFADQSPASTGAAPAITLASGLVAPTLITIPFIQALYTPNGLAADVKSTIWGFTSNQAPTFGNGALLGAGSSANGQLVAPVPEPASAVLAALGLPLGLLLRKRFARV